MIYLGVDEAAKQPLIDQYMAEHDTQKLVVISANAFPLEIEGAWNVSFTETIMYRTFYPLLQHVDSDTLIVLSECLRLQNRYDLHYNCIRNYLNQTSHCLVFQLLPQIDTKEDFMILFDFVTGSRWKRRGWDIDLILDNTQVSARPLSIQFNRINVPTSVTAKKKYAKQREKRFAELGARDPHTIPRNLYLIGGKDKLSHIDSGGERPYVARNQRLKRGNVVSYKTAVASDDPYILVEFPHRFIDFSDFMKTTGQSEFEVLTAELKVDDWYFRRFCEWKDRIDESYSSLQQR